MKVMRCLNSVWILENLFSASLYRSMNFTIDFWSFRKRKGLWWILGSFISLVVCNLRETTPRNMVWTLRHDVEGPVKRWKYHSFDYSQISYIYNKWRVSDND